MTTVTYAATSTRDSAGGSVADIIIDGVIVGHIHKPDKWTHLCLVILVTRMPAIKDGQYISAEVAAVHMSPGMICSTIESLASLYREGCLS